MIGNHRAVRLYVDAKLAVMYAGFGWELLWQREQGTEQLTEPRLLREIGWVILCAGMRETVVRAKFSAISACFFDWKSASAIDAATDECVSRALSVFAHRPKMRAIAEAARILAAKGFCAIAKEVSVDPIAALRQFPYIGPITVYHLAKNLGIPVAKPDRHLSRIAEEFGFKSANALCSEISAYIGDPVEVVDIVLWRYATLVGSLQQPKPTALDS